MNRIADVIIIGGGIIGCSTAFHLARRKREKRIVVVEKGSVASGMTKRSGALIHTNYPHEPEARLAFAGLRFFQNWKEHVGGSCGFTKTGLVTIARDPADVMRLERRAAQMRAIGADIQTLTVNELHAIQPAARVDDIALATYEPDAGYCDPIATTQSLVARAKDWGITFQTGTLVKSIRLANGRIAGIDTNAGALEALTVIVAAGPWSDHLLAPLGVEIGIRSTRAQVAFFDRPSELKSGHAAFDDWATGTHFRPHTFGLTMGSLNSPVDDMINPDHLDEDVAPGFVADVQNRIAARLPAMAQARYVRGHAGVYDMTEDLRPVISRVPHIPGLIIAAGFNGKGFAVAPAVGACIAEMVEDGEASTVDVRELQIRRQVNK
jgi:sarcosine oxidase, subunit beta